MAEQVSEISLLGKIAGYTEILSKDPRSTVFVPLSEAYRKMKMLDDAIEVASKGVTALPQYAPGFIALARAQAENGMVVEAANAFEKVLNLEDENLQGLKGLARVRMMQGRIDDAQILLEKAKSLAPDDQQINNMLDSLSHGTPVVKSALAVGVTAAGLEPDAPIATATLAEIYVGQGLLRKALNIYLELHSGDPSNVGLRSRMDELTHLINLENHEPKAQQEIVGAGVLSKPVAVDEKAATIPTLTTDIDMVVADGDVQSRLNHWLELIRRRRKDVR